MLTRFARACLWVASIVRSHAQPRDVRGHATQTWIVQSVLNLGKRAATAAVLAAVLAVPFASGGCLSRQLAITSEPPGARVWLNDVEIGRTPVAAEFTHFGDYSVRLEHEGYEPLDTHKRTAMPWYEYPPIDLVMTALPFHIETEIAWHFELSPRTPEGDVGLQIEHGSCASGQRRTAASRLVRPVPGARPPCHCPVFGSVRSPQQRALTFKARSVAQSTYEP